MSASEPLSCSPILCGLLTAQCRGFRPRASSAAALPGAASASALKAAGWKRFAPCRRPSLRRFHRVRSIFSPTVSHDDKEGAAWCAGLSPRWSSASSHWSLRPPAPAACRAPKRFPDPLLFRSPSLLPQFDFAQQRLHACEILFRFAHLLQPLGLARRNLETQPEDLLGQLALLKAELVRIHLAVLLHSPRHQSSSARVTNFVLIGNLFAASSMASVAAARSTPAISNMMRPGFTTATQCSGGPLPLPMRVSAGFFVNGLSGKMRIQSFPPRLMKRVIATRDASICRSVIQAGSSAFNPYSPNASEPPRHAFPVRRPRCCFRYFTFFGINIIVGLFPYASAPGPGLPR